MAHEIDLDFGAFAPAAAGALRPDRDPRPSRGGAHLRELGDAMRAVALVLLFLGAPQAAPVDFDPNQAVRMAVLGEGSR